MRGSKKFSYQQKSKSIKKAPAKKAPAKKVKKDGKKK
tara:strand:- start:338 stop:448 length:111 start_codon:yes stop_codon:yes gene_type:complete